MKSVTRTHSMGNRAWVGVGRWAVIAALVPSVLASASAMAAAPADVATSTTAAATLHLGSRGADVQALQSSLARLSYLSNGGVDGAFGIQTWHAVVAFQGWSALSRDGVVGPRTCAALARARRPTPWSTSTGFEIHVGQQVLLLVRNGRVQRAIHVSSGAGGATPLGHFRIYRREVMSWSVPFHVWMPWAQYFSGGYALHEFASVPAYPASHGCVRVPRSESRTVWQFGSI
ncbi:MAG: L,D-transpeptidase family protein, partial [Solirubrobacteraceae bacterium]